MPDQYGNPTEAEMRGQAPAGPVAYNAALANDKESQRQRYLGNGDQALIIGDQQWNGDQYRNSTDPLVVASREASKAAGTVPANLLYGDPKGRKQSKEEKQYRQAYYDKYQKTIDEDWQGQLGPLGMIAAMVALAAGGAALMPAAGGAAAGAGAGGAAGGGVAGLGSGAAGGLQASSGLGVFANGGAAGLAGVGGGNAGALAAAGGITGGAGTGILGSLGGSGLLSSGSIANAARLSSLVSNGQSLLSALNPPKAPESPYAGVSPSAAGPFAPLGPASSTYTDSNGVPLAMGQFDPNGFRDQNASNYLANALGLQPTAMTASAPAGYAPPQNLESFSGMDFGSMFGNLLGMKPPTAGPQSSPKMAPTAMADGTRGPDPSALSGLAALAGPLGNGGGTLAPQYPRGIPRMVK